MRRCRCLKVLQPLALGTQTPCLAKVDEHIGEVNSKKMVLTPKLVKSARELLGWRQLDLSEHAGLSRNTIAQFERGEQLSEDTVWRIQRALELGGIEFLNSGSPGVRLSAGRAAD